MPAKTGEPHPRLPGTVHTAAEVEEAGGVALAVGGDVRAKADVRRAVDAAVERFGGIDIVVDNAGAYSSWAGPETAGRKRFHGSACLASCFKSSAMGGTS